jgi:hypothetical protein
VLSYGGCVIGAVVFDVGECLVDETREYGTWADCLGVPRHVFSAVFGAVIARGLDYRETFQFSSLGLTWRRPGGSGLMRASRNGSARMTCIPMPARRWPGCGLRACGSASRGTRQAGRAASCGAWSWPLT